MTRLRPMTVGDLPAVHTLEEQLFPIDAWPLQMFRDELGQGDTRWYLVAEESADETADETTDETADETTDETTRIGTAAGSRIIGYAGLMCVHPLADVQTIAVTPDREGRGIGTALLTALVEESRRRGAEDVLLEVRRDNPRAQRLYRRFGFEQIHDRPRYYRDGVDALIMRKRLRDSATRPGQDPS